MREPEIIAFSREHLWLVADFECGDQPWSRAAATWIKSAPPFPGAIQSIEQRGNRVWLYRLDEEIIGFSSLGTNRWPVPPPDGPKKKVAFIPQMAVAAAFHGQPPGERRYAHCILEDVIEKARNDQFDHLCLLVHEANQPARRLYLRYGFVEHDSITRPGIAGRFLRMSLGLRAANDP